MFADLTARVVRGDELLTELQRQADHDRGFAEGMVYITKAVIAGAKTTLAKLEQGEQPDQPEVEDRWSYESAEPAAAE